MKFKFSYDKKLNARTVEVEKGYEIFAKWIEDDIQSSISSIDIIESQIENVRSGVVERVQSDGNSFVAFIDKRGVKLWNIYTNESSEVSVSIDEVLDLLQGWRKEVE